jgi:hypothetical protein
LFLINAAKDVPMKNSVMNDKLFGLPQLAINK